MTKPKWPSCEQPQADQSQSPLFGKISGEVRNKIFKYTLSVYEDQSRAYDENTSYRRPDTLLPTRSISLSFKLARRSTPNMVRASDEQLGHSVWLATHFGMGADSLDQRFKVSRMSAVRESLQRIYETRGYITQSHVRVLAWLGGTWINGILVPNSVTELRLELETVKRKSTALDQIATDVCPNWRFRKVNGDVTTPSLDDCQTSEWMGSSIWDDYRWLKDESSPNLIAYYVQTIAFKMNRGLEWHGDIGGVEEREPWQPFSIPAYVTLQQLSKAQIPKGAIAKQVADLLDQARQAAIEAACRHAHNTMSDEESTEENEAILGELEDMMNDSTLSSPGSCAHQLNVILL